MILWLSRVWREVSTGSVTALIGAPLLWLLPRLRSISAPVMNGGDNVQPGALLCAMVCSRRRRVAAAGGERGAGLWSRCPRLAVAHGDLLEQLLPRAGRGYRRPCSPGSCWRSPAVLSSA
nr:hypothetical protein [Klebsiella pneumoniae subsp. pneumoniae]